MRKIIHNLRQQPEETRRHVLHLLTGVCAFILVLLWTLSLGGNFRAPEESNSANAIQPFSAIKDNLVEGYESLSQPAGVIMLE